jgi:hypothetical protein
MFRIAVQISDFTGSFSKPFVMTPHNYRAKYSRNARVVCSIKEGQSCPALVKILQSEAFRACSTKSIQFLFSKIGFEKFFKKQIIRHERTLEPEPRAAERAATSIISRDFGFGAGVFSC